MNPEKPEPIEILSKWCPITPTSKQRLFYESTDRELFFGGAAGGGKSVALLLGALRYIDVPGYAALIIRKDFSRLELAGGLIPRSHEWFGRLPTAQWIASRRQWVFPIAKEPQHAPATIMFGYLTRPLDKFRYASSEFQYIAFDELTDFSEEDYLFLFSRLRRSTGVQVPLRMRSASNPGGVGHAWVKERFIPEGSEFGVQGSERGNDQIPEPRTPNPEPLLHKHGRFYIPSRIEDNPHLDATAYRQSLLHLPPLARERLMNGDWSVQESGLIHAEWLRYYVAADGQLELLAPDGRAVAIVGDNACHRFVTIDPAGTSQERTREAQGRTASWSVVQVWDQPPRELAKFLILREEVRRRVGFSDLCALVRHVHARWQPEQIWIEGEKLGVAVCDVLRGELPIECLSTRSKDKATRAGPLLMKLERGEVFLPKHNTTWRLLLEGELLAWTGDERQAADQIDAAAYAAIVAERRMQRAVRVVLGAARS